MVHARLNAEEHGIESNSVYHEVFHVQNRSEFLNILIPEIKRILRFYGENKNNKILLRETVSIIEVMFVTSLKFNLSENSLSLYSEFNLFEKLLDSNAKRRNLNLEFWFYQIDSENLDFNALYSDGYKYIYKLGRFIEINRTENEN